MYLGLKNQILVSCQCSRFSLFEKIDVIVVASEKTSESSESGKTTHFSPIISLEEHLMHFYFYNYHFTIQRKYTKRYQSS